MDAYPHVEAGLPVAHADQLALTGAFGQQDQAGPHRVLGIVFARGLGAEHREHAVARVLQHPAVVGLRDGGESRQRAVHERVHVFRVELLAELGGADDVDEEDSGLLQLLLGGGGLQGGEAGAERGERGVDYRVADDGALGV